MKRKIFLPLFFLLVFSAFTNAQVLNVPQVIQEQNQWCWAGCSKCILDYYGFPEQQCDIAEYARTVITWNNFGSVNCCVDPNQGCNYWNYNYGSAGSIQDILVHFGTISNYGTSSALSTSAIASEASLNHPFVIRWGWYSGGGHFIVGHGISGNNVYYMNPWFGEGLHIGTYSWMNDDSVHVWTHTNVITSAPTAIFENNSANAAEIFPNPANENFTVSVTENLVNAEFVLCDVSGREVMRNKLTEKQSTIHTDGLAPGVYLYTIQDSGALVKNGKIVLE
jgi:hypothetical protein